MMRSRSQSNVGHQRMLRKLFCITIRNRRSNTTGPVGLPDPAGIGSRSAPPAAATARRTFRVQMKGRRRGAADARTACAGSAPRRRPFIWTWKGQQQLDCVTGPLGTSESLSGHHPSPPSYTRAGRTSHSAGHPPIHPGRDPADGLPHVCPAPVPSSTGHARPDASSP